MDRDEHSQEESQGESAARAQPRGRVQPENLRREAVLRTFLDADGRLVSMPARWGKRRFVLEHVVCAFEPGVKYAEVEVNAILRAFYEEDYVSLRRYLIDAALMAREDGVYWRTGGYVVV